MIGGGFRIDAHWPDAPEADKRDVAQLSLWARDECLTKLLDLQAREERTYFRSSAVSLAFWFTDNWWRLRYESLHDNRFPDANWRLHHELTSSPGGTLWPPLMFNSTGERVLIASIFGPPVTEGSIRYLSPDVHSVSGAGFETGVETFLKTVLNTCAKAQDAAALQILFHELDCERKDPETAAWRMLEAQLGFDPDRAPPQLIDAFEELEKTVGEDGISEAAAALPGLGSASALSDALASSKASDLRVEFETVKTISRQRIAAASAPPWQLGEEAAFQLREQKSLPDGPLRSTAFCDLLSITPLMMNRATSTAKNAAYATRIYDRGDRHKVALQSAYPRDRRFELACMLGDAIWAASDFGLVSRSKTDRQKFQRAFAQNLLVPYPDLKRVLKTDEPDQHDIDRAATAFHVNANVIRRLLILKRVVRQETLEEQLEAA